MAGSLPQSLETQQFSALIDPFGLSAYFMEARDLTAHQKNIQLVPFSGYLLFNRILFFFISVGILLLSHRLFSFSNTSGQKVKTPGKTLIFLETNGAEYSTVTPRFNGWNSFRSVLSFTKRILPICLKALPFLLYLFFYYSLWEWKCMPKLKRDPSSAEVCEFRSYGGHHFRKNFHLFGLLISAYF